MNMLKPFVGIVALASFCVTATAADWKPAHGPLMTRWAKDVSPDKVHPDYPRPQLVRKDWQNLNGLWEYAIGPKDGAQPEKFDGQILVPFPVESALSGVMKRVGPEKRLWYRLEISAPPNWNGKNIRLHFEAVDWETTVFLDGQALGTHRGGYDPFTYDVTHLLTLDKPHNLVLSVWDPSDAGTQPCGKQHNKPEGIYYTPSTGIWQTVWLEPVAPTHLHAIGIGIDLVSRIVTINPVIAGPTENIKVSAEVPGEGGAGKVFGEPNQPLQLALTGDAIKLWSPDSPFLYPLSIEITKSDGQQTTPLDHVESYFAARTINVAPGPDKKMRIQLNGKPVFLIGPLDQGFWPDGLYTAPTDEALKSDIEVTKQLGFNFIRKHVKVEPARWYYWCDKLGVVVFQDMPSGDRHVPEHSKKAREIKRTSDSTSDFDAELKAMIDARRQFPCIITWVPFNEGWGQFDTVRIANWVKSYDPGRLVDPASGWTDFPVGDMHDIHDYPGPSAPPAEPTRAAVLGEFGGLGLPIPGHLWVDTKKNWGYRKFANRDALTDAYLKLTIKLKPLVTSHLSAAVYTQTTDCETEVNGLMTYDRELIKMDVEKIRAANTGLVHLLDSQSAKAE
jgi:beta-galactosidase/beta-glucuronidase